MDKRTALLYVQLKQYKYLVQKTNWFIEWALSQVNSPYVSCSFGKDSSVMLDLVVKQIPGIAVNFLCKSETDLIDDYSKVITWWKKNRDVDTNRISYLGWLEGSTKTGIAANMPDNGNDAFFVGLRKDESFGRGLSLRKHGKFFKMKSGKIRVSPLADWKVTDIAAYMVANELPVLNAYIREGFEARTTSNIPSKYPQESIARLKDADISAYNKLLKLLPDAKYFT